MKTTLKLLAILAIGFAVTAPVHAAEFRSKGQVLQQIKIKIKTGVMELNASDCRLAGGTVVVPGDDRCGKMGAAYCRYPDTMAACLTE